MAISESAMLRGRADDLRRLAVSIESIPALELAAHAGDDTWRGARPTFCVSTWMGHRRCLIDAAFQLRTDARRLDLRANALDVATSTIGPR